MRGVSVVIPARNAGRFLGEALDSVHVQGLEGPEVVVVDDGSTDDTEAVARGYGRGVRVFRQTATGSGRARNAGLAATSGERVAFLDADDVWMPEKSRLQMEVLDRDPSLGLVFSDMISFGDGGPADRTFFEERGFDGRCSPSSVFLYDMVSTPTVIARRSCLEAVGGFDEELPIGQDTDLWLRIALAFPFAVVPRPLVRRRLHAGNVTRDHRLLARCSEEVWRRHLASCIEREPEMRRRLAREYSRRRWDHRFGEGCSLLREGRSGEARRCLREAIAAAPFRPRGYAFYLLSLLGPVGGALRRRR